MVRREAPLALVERTVTTEHYRRVPPAAHPTTRSNAMSTMTDNMKTAATLVACYLVGYYGLTFLHWALGA